MMPDNTLSVRTALFQLLVADAPLKLIIGNPARVWDNVPKNQVFPYVRLGDDIIQDFGTKTETGQEFELTIHSYDQSPANRGQKTINQIQSRLYDLLHEQPVLGSYLLRFKYQHTTNDDGLSWHGVSRYRLLI